jgi:hypothetical protein
MRDKLLFLISKDRRKKCEDRDIQERKRGKRSNYLEGIIRSYYQSFV